MIRDCKHGQLARSCNICDLEETIRCQQIVLDQIAQALGLEPGDVAGIGAAIDQLKVSESDCLDALTGMIIQHVCQDAEKNYDSMALSANATAMLILTDAKRMVEVATKGRRVIAYFPEDKALAAGEAG